MLLKVFWGIFFIFASAGICYICNAYTLGLVLAAIFALIVLFFTVVSIYQGIKEKNKSEIIKQSIAFIIILAAFWFSAPLKSKGDFSDQKCAMTIVRSDGSEYTCNAAANGGKEKTPMSFKFKYYCSECYDSLRESSSTNKNDKDSYGHDKSDAWSAARDVVLGQLKSPSSADFCRSTEATITRRANSWTIKGYVDAENSFGATIRNNFTVKITFTSKDNYTIDLCTIAPR